MLKCSLNLNRILKNKCTNTSATYNDLFLCNNIETTLLLRIGKKYSLFFLSANHLVLINLSFRISRFYFSMRAFIIIVLRQK